MDLNGEITHNHEGFDEVVGPKNHEGFDEVVDPNKLARFVMPKRNENDSEYLDIKKVLW